MHGHVLGDPRMIRTAIRFLMTLGFIVFVIWRGRQVRSGKFAGKGTKSGKPVDLDAYPGLKTELDVMIKTGRKIEAIKRVRERTGVGLKAAKDAVERLGAKR